MLMLNTFSRPLRFPVGLGWRIPPVAWTEVLVRFGLKVSVGEGVEGSRMRHEARRAMPVVVSFGEAIGETDSRTSPS